MEKKLSLAKIGTKQSEETKKKRSISLSGRIRSIEERRSISQGQIGKIVSEQTRQLQRMRKLGTKQSESHKIAKLRGWTPDKRHLASERRAKQKIPLFDTMPEKITGDILKKYKIKYTKHHPIKLETVVKIHQADFFMIPNKVIEIYGTYHHADPTVYEDEKILRVRGHHTALKIREFDSKIVKGMEEKGFNVLIIWQRELEKNLAETEKRIVNFIFSNKS